MTTFIYVCFFFLLIRLPPCSTLFPYTTLFRSVLAGRIAPVNTIGASASCRTSHSIAVSSSVSVPCVTTTPRSEEHTSELQSRLHLVCRLLLEKKKKKKTSY